MATETTRLSEQQKDILTWLLRRYADHGVAPDACWGVRWNDGQFYDRSEHASLSRTLHRLEARGLVRRRNDRSDSPYDKPTPEEIQDLIEHFGETKVREYEERRLRSKHRTTCVLLTPEGWRLAEELQKEAETVNKNGDVIC